MTRTPFGRHVYAVGGNESAAWLSGIRVARVRLAVYSICGMSAGLAGVMVASRLNAGYPRAGEYDELDAIAAVVVGGTSLFGGSGSVWSALAGAFFIGILNNGLNLYRVSPYEQLVVKGVVLLEAVRRFDGCWFYGLQGRTCGHQFTFSNTEVEMKAGNWQLEAG